MQSVAGGYALRFSNRYERCGHLFQNRFESRLVRSDSYLRELVCDIH